jgi:hypothetical protein
MGKKKNEKIDTAEKNKQDSGKLNIKIGVAGGRLLDLDDIDESIFTVRGIAIALSKICRFNGQTIRHWSVAQHSMFVANLVEKKYELEALLHDAAEAYVGDVIRPIKKELVEFQMIEDMVATVIAEKFDALYPWPGAVMDADMEAGDLEYDYLVCGERLQIASKYGRAFLDIELMDDIEIVADEYTERLKMAIKSRAIA